MKMSRIWAVIGCLPAVALAETEILLDQELNGLDVRTWIVESEQVPDVLTPENYQRLRLTNNHESTVHCTLEPEPAEDSWTFFPEATLRTGEEVELRIGGDYSTETIRAKLVCEDTELL